MNTKLLESVKLALEMEKKGYDLYVKTARENDHPVISSTFQGLAQRELEHIRRIEILYETVAKESVDYKKIKEISVPIEKQEILNLIMEELKKRLSEKPHSKVTAVYEIALQLEKESYNYYKKLAKEIADPAIKNLFELIAAEEDEHYAIIQESRLYLDQPQSWFFGKERWIVEGN